MPDIENIKPPQLDAAANNIPAALGAPLDFEEAITSPPEQELIVELRSITDFWFFWANVCIWLHWTVGLIGIVAATLAANNRFQSNWIAGFATTAAVCLAITGLVNPQKRASKFLVAYRSLDPAIRAYKFYLLSKKKLLEIHGRTEAILGEGEFDGK